MNRLAIIVAAVNFIAPIIVEGTCSSCPNNATSHLNGASCCQNSQDLAGNPIHYTSISCGGSESFACPGGDSEGSCCNDNDINGECDSNDSTSTECPCHTYPFFGGRYCCRQNNDGYDNEIRYDSISCISNDFVACPAESGVCIDTIDYNSIQSTCTLCPDGAKPYLNGKYCCRESFDKDDYTLNFTSLTCKDNNFIACPSSSTDCCDDYEEHVSPANIKGETVFIFNSTKGTSLTRRSLKQQSSQRELQSGCTNDIYNHTIAEVIKTEIEIVLTNELNRSVTVDNYTQTVNEDCLIEFGVEFTIDNSDGNAPSASAMLELVESDDLAANLVVAIKGNAGNDVVNSLDVVYLSVGPVLPEMSNRFSYDLTYKDVTVMFSEAKSNEEISIQYNISLRDRGVTIYDYDTCSSEVSTDVIGVLYGLEQKSSTHGDLTVLLDIKQDAVVGSSVWENGTDPLEKKSFIGLCVKVDMYEKDTTRSVTFHELKVNITIDMSKTFAIESISTDRDVAATMNENTSLDYDVRAYQCNAAGVAEQLTLSQGDICGVCVEVNATTDNIYVASISELNFIQNDVTYQAIRDGAVTELAAMDCTGIIPGTCVTRTQLVSGFFNEDNPEPIRVDGVSVLAFGNARRLSNAGRSLQFAADDASMKKTFDFQIGISKTKDTDTKPDEAYIYMDDSAGASRSSFFNFFLVTVSLLAFMLELLV